MESIPSFLPHCLKTDCQCGCFHMIAENAVRLPNAFIFIHFGRGDSADNGAECLQERYTFFFKKTFRLRGIIIKKYSIQMLKWIRQWSQRVCYACLFLKQPTGNCFAHKWLLKEWMLHLNIIFPSACLRLHFASKLSVDLHPIHFNKQGILKSIWPLCLKLPVQMLFFLSLPNSLK